MNFMIYPRALLNENKWRASRYGIDDKLIDFGKEQEINTRALILELLDFIDDVVDELGCREALKAIHIILEKGTGADKQLQEFNKTNDLKAVAAFIESKFLTAL
jgi:carboxylate-amine ligase